MKIFRKASELEPNLVSIKDKGQSIGLVLTMGNLHDGHLSLIREAQLHNEFVICSIFINPTQFNNENDFNSYPKTIDEDISKFKLLPPISNPNKIICLAFNYVDHAKEQGLQAPDDPAIVIKPRTALNGTNSEIICPDFVTQLDYEVELAIIIGENCKNISVNDAQNVIFGYMVFHDVSARDIQFKDKQFTRGKSFDSFAPCGPWITTKDEINDPQNLKITTKVNGKIRQNSSTSNMFIKIPEIISKISKVMTLEKGDIISTGTPAGVMLNKPDAEFLKDGDKVEMEIEGLGILNNTIKFVKSN